MAEIMLYVYGAALGIGLVYSVAQIVFQGLDDALDALEFDLDLDDGGEFSVSMLAISWFITAFGGFGIIAQEGLGANPALGLLVALAGGVVFGGIAQIIFIYVLNKTNSSHITQSELVGREAEIHTPVPAGGVGQISIIAGGERLVYSARAIKNDMEFGRGKPVRIHKVVGSVAHIAPLEFLVPENNELSQ